VAISAQSVKELREKTGAGIMDCKKALFETNGDLDKAIKHLREKGLAEAKKRSGREAKEGIITVIYSEDGNTVCMVEVNCETDFVSRTDEYRQFVQSIAQTVLDNDVADVQYLPDEIHTRVKEAITSFGENILVRKVARFTKSDEKRSVFQSYIHLNGRVGVIVEFLVEKGSHAESEQFGEAAKNIALQIASMAPLAVSKDDFPRDILEEQKSIFEKQAKESGKPENIIEKIVKGKIEKYLSEFTLEGQKYVKNSDITVKKYLEEAGQKAGGEIEIKRFARFKLGEE
jgi:elongation factor Ts